MPRRTTHVYMYTQLKYTHTCTHVYIHKRKIYTVQCGHHLHGENINTVHNTHLCVLQKYVASQRIIVSSVLIQQIYLLQISYLLCKGHQYCCL